MKSRKSPGKTTLQSLILLLVICLTSITVSAQTFSDKAEVQNLMVKGENSFKNKDYDEAIKFYLKALELEPTNYYAALFIGDMHFRKNDFADAEIWFQKAMKINPNIETAYRYSATPLMQQKKYNQARDRYVEAFITEPYNERTANGLTGWAKVTKKSLGHPKMNIPEFKIGEDGKAESNITVNLFGGEDDASSLSWIAYTSTRTEWLEKKFAQNFPNEKQYRHTLKEETEALRSVVEMAKELKKKKLNPEFKTLVELDQKGLLEAYILMAIADNGIAQDHAEYLKNNRDKLRRYVMEYVIRN